MRTFPRVLVWVCLLGAAAIRPVLAQPQVLERHAAVYDSLTDRMYVFGGLNPGAELQNDIWALTLSGSPAWTRLPAANPPPARFGATLTLDPVRHRLIVIGGQAQGNDFRNDVWQLPLDGPQVWEQLSPLGTPPGARREHTAVYDPAGDRILLYGGGLFAQSIVYADLWALELAPEPRWVPIAVKPGPAPQERARHVAVWDRANDRMVLFGGGSFDAPRNDTWALSLADTQWTALAPSGAPPPVRQAHAVALDTHTNSMIVVGGESLNEALSDSWQLPLTGPLRWQALPARSAPSPRLAHTLVYDSRRQRVVSEGGFPSDLAEFEPTLALDLPAGREWGPLRPVLRAVQDTLRLGRITVGDTASLQLRLESVGMRAVTVDSLTAVQPDLAVEAGSPFPLGWRQSRDITVTLAASVPGVRNDALRISSNDPRAPLQTVVVQSEVLALDFGLHVLDSPAEVPLGESFVVVATPAAGVHVEEAVLHYRVAGSGAEFDSVRFSALATDLVATIPARAVREQGVEYYAEVRNSGHFARVPAEGTLTPRFQPVAPPNSMSLRFGAGDAGPFVRGEEVLVEAVLPEGASLLDGFLEFRLGGESARHATTFAEASPGHWRVTIPDSFVTERGLEYRAIVNTRTAQLSFPQAAGEWAVLPVLVAQLTEPARHPGERYRLLSLPLDFSGFAGGLADLLSDQLGTLDRKRWRAFGYQGGAYRELSGHGDPLFDAFAGRAYWLITRAPHQVDTAPVAALAHAPSRVIDIPLEAGWNLVGNPFAFAIPWSNVHRDPAVVTDIRRFDPAAGVGGRYAHAALGTLDPFEGYFVYATRAETLHVDPRATSEPAKVLPQSAAAASGWRVAITTRSERTGEDVVRIGMAPESVPGWDALDARKPPVPPGGWAESSLERREESLERLEADLQPESGDGTLWEVIVRSDAPGEPLDWLLGAEPSSGPHPAMRVYDRDLGLLIAEIPAGSGAGELLHHRLVSRGPQGSRIAIAAGSAAFLASAFSGGQGGSARLELAPAFPDPVREATTLRFSLPHASAVSLEILDVSGRRVWTASLAGQLTAGAHAVVWDGRTSLGGRAAPGLYLVRLATPAGSRTGRLVVVR